METNYSTRLTGTEDEKYGLAKSLSVMPGDTITMEVYAKYLDTNSDNWNAALTNLITSIAQGTAPAGTYVDGGAAGSIGGTTFPFVGTLPRDGDSGAGPNDTEGKLKRYEDHYPFLYSVSNCVYLRK